MKIGLRKKTYGGLNQSLPMTAIASDWLIQSKNRLIEDSCENGPILPEGSKVNLPEMTNYDNDWMSGWVCVLQD